MSKNHFVSHFLLFQINTTIFVTLFTKWLLVAILLFGCPKNHFRSHFWTFQINTNFFFKFLQNGHRRQFGCPKFTFDRISGHFRSIRNFIFSIFVIFFTKWLPAAILNVRKSLSVAILAISDKYKTFIYVFLQNGHLRPFWMSEIHFRAHFWPFQINTQLFFLFSFVCDFFYKIAAGGHFRCPKITFGRISDHFRSI